MAKCNVGNLLKHFVLLTVAKEVVESTPPARRINYIDFFSMADWESVEKSPANKEYRAIVEAFPSLNDDFVANTFQQAWHSRYQDQIPVKVAERLYPNSAVLLRTAFPNTPWKMHLHDASEDKRNKLKQWADSQVGIDCQVDGEWGDPKVATHAAVPEDERALIMFDPLKVVPDPGDKQGKLPNGHLRKGLIVFALGRHRLDVLSRLNQTVLAPATVLLFSYSDTKPGIAQKVVESVFPGWQIDRVIAEPYRHQGWVIRSHPVLEPSGASLQDRWNDWVARCSSRSCSPVVC